MLRQKPAQILPWKLLKKAIIPFYCLFDESRFSDKLFHFYRFFRILTSKCISRTILLQFNL